MKQKLAEITKDDSENDNVVKIVAPIAKNEPEKGNVHNYSTPSEKIALFRNLFRGREDCIS